jgi:two-component system OmpR family sensor kinase
MDGLKRRLNESVQLKLSFTLSLAILVVAVVAGVFSFLSAFDDRQRLLPAVPTTDIRLKDVDEESRVIVQRLGEVSPSTVGVDAGGVLPLPATLADGLHTLEVGGETFRVLVKTTASGERIAVAQESGFRNEIAGFVADATLRLHLAALRRAAASHKMTSPESASAAAPPITLDK